MLLTKITINRERSKHNMKRDFIVYTAKNLKKDGKRIKSIAQEIGVCERTVYNYLNKKESVETKRRVSKLDPFKDFILDELNKDSDLNCEVLFDKLLKRGYLGKISILRDYVRAEKKLIRNKAVIRFETIPGLQAQVDWKELSKKEKKYEFVMTLGYSRLSFTCFTDSMNQSVLHDSHVRAFEYFGGVPQEILYDNMKTAFVYDYEHGWRPNKHLQQLALHYGFKPIRCRVRRPQTKGKVERFIGFATENFLKQVDWRSLSHEELDESALRWLEQIKHKPISGLRESRHERFEKEKPHLQVLPKLHFDVSEIVEVKVSREAKITYKTNRYSVPAKYIGQSLTLKAHPRTRVARLYSGRELVREWVLLEPGLRDEKRWSEDIKSLQELWLKQNRPKIKKHLEKKPDVAAPSLYERINWGCA
jgi:transposase